MRVLAVVYCYPPLRVPASLCYMKLVLGLRALGHAVDLVSIDPASFDGIGENLLDREVLAVCPRGIREIRVHSPEAHLLVRGIKKFSFSYELFHRFLEPRKREWTYAARRALRELDRSRYDVLLSCSQPHANHLLGRWIREKTGLPWVAYFSDPWLGNPYTRWRSRRIQEWNTREEASVIAAADRVLFTCEEMRNAVARRFPAGLTGKFGVLPHCHVPEWYGPDADDGKTGTGPYLFLHTGHFYGPRHPLHVFGAIRRLKDSGRLNQAVRFEFYGIMPEEQKARVREMGIESLVSVRDSVPYLESLRLMGRSDALLVIDAPLRDQEESVFLPSKLIDYYGSGKRIVGVTPSRGATARFLKETGHLVCPVDDEEAIAATLLRAMSGTEAWNGRPGRRGGYDHLSVAARCTEFLRQATEIARRPASDVHRVAVAGIFVAALFLRLLFSALAGAEVSGENRAVHPAPPGSETAATTGWLDPAWPYRTRISVRPEKIAGNGTHAGMPLLLVLSSVTTPRVFQLARPDGSDLVVTRGDGVTPLPVEVVSFDPLGGTGEVWFLADSLSAAQRQFYLYYGSGSDCDFCPGDPVWADRYLGVFHFEDDPALGLLDDSGPGGHTAFAPAFTGWTSSNRVAGQIGSGWWMNGSTNWIDADNLASPDSTFTVSAWFAPWNQMVDANFALSSQSGFHLSVKRNESQRMPDFAGTRGYFTWNPAPLPDTLLHSLTWVMDGVADTIRFYFDGLEQGVRVRYAPLPPHKVYTGMPLQGQISIAGPLFAGNPLDLFEGIVDEFRVYRGTRGPDWILTEFRDQKSPQLFFEYQDEVVGGAPLVPLEPANNLGRIRVIPNPFTRYATIEVDLIEETPLRVEIFDISGRRVRNLLEGRAARGPLRLVWDGNDGDGASLASGVYLLRIVAGVASIERKVIQIR